MTKFLKLSVIIILFGINQFSKAQIIKPDKNKLPTYPLSFIGTVKQQLLKPENESVEFVRFQIQVMSPGKDVSDTNSDYWFASYGISDVIVSRSVNPITKVKSIHLGGSNNIKYWFNDRVWTEAGFRKQFSTNCCIDNSPKGSFENPNLGYCVLPNYHPFSTEGAESGSFIITGNKLNLFNEWSWQVKNSFQIGSILYGELENGFTFSLSYRFVATNRVN